MRAFLKDIEDVKALGNPISEPQPSLTFATKDKMPVISSIEFNHDQEEDAYTWLYADAWEHRS